MTGLAHAHSNPLVRTTVPCRIRHQKGLAEPYLIVPTTLFQMAVDCLRRIRFHQRKNEYEAQEGVSEDADIKQLIKAWKRLDDRLWAFFEKLDREGYSVPRSVQSVPKVRSLVSHTLEHS